MARLLGWAAGVCRRGREELRAILVSLPAILCNGGGASSQGPSNLLLTHKYVVGLFAFLISVDLVEIVGILCYQLFTAIYFPWHLYPLMLNRGAELLSLICARGQILSAGLHLIGMATRQNEGRVHNVEDENLPSSRLTLQKLMDMEPHQAQLDSIFAVEQPDGQRIAIAKLCKELKLMDESTNTQPLKLMDESTNTHSTPNISNMLKDKIEDMVEEVEGNTSSYGESQGESNQVENGESL